MDAEDYRNTFEVILRTGYLALSRQELDEAPYPYETKATLRGVVRFLANTPRGTCPKCHAEAAVMAGPGCCGEVLFGNVGGFAQIYRAGACKPIAAVPAGWDYHLGLWPMTTTNTSNTIRLIAVADIHNLVLSERLNWHRTSEEALA